MTYRPADGREETLSGTEEHPYFVVGKGFLPAKLLAEGDELSLIDGVQADVVGLGTEDAARVIPPTAFTPEGQPPQKNQFAAADHAICKTIRTNLKLKL